MCSQEKKQKNQADEEYCVRSKAKFGEVTYHRWSDRENQYYAQFLEDNKEEFEGSSLRRSKKFFNRMAKGLNIGKNNLQCRSHHQKMLKRFGSINEIIAKLLSCPTGSQNLESRKLTSKGEHQLLSQGLQISKDSAWSLYSPY